MLIVGLAIAIGSYGQVASIPTNASAIYTVDDNHIALLEPGKTSDTLKIVDSDLRVARSYAAPKTEALIGFTPNGVPMFSSARSDRVWYEGDEAMLVVGGTLHVKRKDRKLVRIDRYGSPRHAALSNGALIIRSTWRPLAFDVIEYSGPGLLSQSQRRINPTFGGEQLAGCDSVSIAVSAGGQLIHFVDGDISKGKALVIGKPGPRPPPASDWDLESETLVQTDLETGASSPIASRSIWLNNTADYAPVDNVLATFRSSDLVALLHGGKLILFRPTRSAPSG